MELELFYLLDLLYQYHFRRLILKPILYTPLVLFLFCTTGERTNPFDSEGDNWNQPVVTIVKDTSVNINNSLTINVTASDNGSIMKYIWAINSQNFIDTTNSGSFTINFDDTGHQVIKVKAIDDDGVHSLPDSSVINVTLDPPIITGTNDTTANINDDLTIKVTASDNGSITKYIWAINGQNFIDTTNSASFTINFNDTGHQVIKVKAIDDDGVLSLPDSSVVIVTLDPPVVTGKADTSFNFTTDTTIMISVIATDNNPSLG